MSHWLGSMAFFVLSLTCCLAGSIPGWAEISIPASVRQGETIELKISQADLIQAKVGESPSFVFNGRTYPLYRAENSKADLCWQGLLAIPCDLNAGGYEFKIGSENHDLKVSAVRFPIQRLSLPKTKDNFDMSPNEKEAIETAKATTSPARFWQTKFVAPCKAPQSAKFGLKRIVNGRLLKDYYHTGLDFAAPLGTAVYACAPGLVILARQGFKLHGNVVAIDHGQGVISLYIHLQDIFVREGMKVEGSQKIGTVGQSGRATGPHLHFGIYVHQTASNPSQWLTTTF